MSSPLGLVTEFWAEWGFRITVLSSLAAYLLLGLLSGTRRRSASGWRWWLQRLVALILWSAYWVSDRATTSALGKLSLSGSDASDGEHQLVSFWAPFLLLHLGGPDSITAYALEDNKLSRRKAVDVIAPLVGVLYLILSYYPCDGRLFVASMIIFFLGAAKCAERAYAQWRANLDKKHDEEEEDDDEEDESLEDDVESLIQELMGADGDQPGNSSSNGEALLLLAQQLFRGWRRALVDSSVEPSSSSVERASQKIFSLGSDGTRAVVEMELSLMYEYLFTKAILAQIVPKLYYSIRFISPFATAAAGSFFWHWLHAAGDGRRSLCIIRGSFIAITYLLLATAFVVDVVWLLRALGSTWTYAFLKAWSPSSSSCAWLHHHVLCAGRWRCLHRAAMYYLDPLWRFSTAPDPISYRRWSGVIGRYNLLHECTATARRGACSSFCHRLATKFGLEEARYLCELPPEVSKLVFERVQQILPTTPKSKNDPHHPAGADDTYSMAAITTSWGQEALEKAKAARLFPGIPDGELPKFGKEFEQDVLAWHIATSVFLSRAKVGKVAKSSSSTHGGHVLAIEAMSEYLMFLVAQRRQMLPGLVLDKLCKVTRRALDGIWRRNINGEEGIKRTCSAGEDNKEKLATILRRKRIDDKDWAIQDPGMRLVSDAVVIAATLTKSSMRQQQVPRMLQFIFNVWVDKLLYAGVKCSRDSHAQQLSRGGELTTILWLTAQHAGAFRIGELKPCPPTPEKPPSPSPSPPSSPRPPCPHDPCPYPTPCPPLPLPSWPRPCSYPTLSPPLPLPPCPYPTLCPRPCPYPTPCPHPYPPLPPCPTQAQPPWVQGWWPPCETPMSDVEKIKEHELPMPLKEEEPEGAKEPEIPLPDDDDSMDADEYKVPINYITLY